MNERVRRLGIVGTGRLGRALATCLQDGVEVLVFDADVRKAKQLAKRAKVTYLPFGRMVQEAEAVALAIPGTAIAPLLNTLPAAQRSRPLFLNLATDLDTRTLLASLEAPRPRVIGLKPIGQFAAIAQGLPLTFVTSHRRVEELAPLRRLLSKVGTLEIGDEARVGLLNRRATEATLRFCLRLEDQLAPLAADGRWVRSALHNLAVGTILDYPPSPDNAYTRPLIETLRAEEPTP